MWLASKFSNFYHILLDFFVSIFILSIFDQEAQQNSAKTVIKCYGVHLLRDCERTHDTSSAIRR